jgi:hypothetical protein
MTRLGTVCAAAVAIAALLTATPSRASLSATLGSNPQPGDQNVLLNAGSGSTVTGHTDGTNTTVQFSSFVDQLLVNPNDQSMIQGAGHSGINQITITVPGFTFTDLIFNPAGSGAGPFTSGAPVTLGVLANASGGTASMHLTSTPAYTIGSGNNFASIMATGGETMTSVTISLFYGSVFSDLEQVKVGGLEPVKSVTTFSPRTPGGGDAPVVVPEPSAILVWSLLILPAAAFWRRYCTRK